MLPLPLSVAVLWTLVIVGETAVLILLLRRRAHLQFPAFRPTLRSVSSGQRCSCTSARFTRVCLSWSNGSHMHRSWSL